MSWLIIDANSKGHRSKYHAILNNNLKIPVILVGDYFFRIKLLIIILSYFFKSNKKSVLFTSGDSCMPLLFLINIVFSKSVFICHRLSRFSLSSNILIVYYRKLYKGVIFTPCETLVSSFRCAFPSAKVLLLTDPIKANLLDNQLRFNSKLPLNLLIKSDGYSNEVNLLLTELAYNKLVIVNVIGNVSKKNQFFNYNSFLTEENYSLLLSNADIFIFAGEMGEYFSSSIIEALAAGKIVIGYPSDWFKAIIEAYPNSAFNYEDLLKMKLCIYSNISFRMSEIESVRNKYSETSFLNDIILVIKD